MRIVLTGGGTGGHVTPLVAVAKELMARAKIGAIPFPESHEPPLELLYLGVVMEGDRQALQEAGIPYRHIPSGKIRRYISGTPRTLLDLLFRVPAGVLRALWVLFFVMPDVVFSKGGYGSVPVVFAAWLYRIPILLHETDVAPGLANTRLARYATAIAVGFREAESAFREERKVFVSGTPLRSAFRSLPDQAAARRRLSLHDRKPVLFVTGGSQGAQRINAVVLAVAPSLLSDMQILHQVGANNLAAIREFVEGDLRHAPGIEDYHVTGSLGEEDMAAAFAAADFVVSRAGGTALAEIASAGKPSILIPLRGAAQEHQWENAYFFREQGAAVVLDETNLSPALFLSTVRRVLGNPRDLQLMAARVRTLHRPGAASDIAEVLVAMAQGRVPRRTVAALPSR